MAKHEHVRVAVIGSGFGGLGAAVRLRREGITDFVVLERGDSVGGTWRDNSYPGCACDVPSHLYSFSFAPNPDWPRVFSGQSHIRAYLEHLTDTFGLRPHLRLNHEVLLMRWIADAPVPITATRLPRRSYPWSQRAEWKTLPGNESSPGTSGTLGSDSGPVAETTTSAVKTPREVSISQCAASAIQRISSTSWFSRRCGRSPKVSVRCSR